MQYLVEGITKDIIAYLMEDSGCDLPTALKEFYNSETFAKLSDESTGLYIESSAYVYEMLKGELKYQFVKHWDDLYFSVGVSYRF